MPVCRVLEGAANNLPDLAALRAAEEILALCQGANEGEVVVALISGGGSALLPYPIEGVTLQDKCLVLTLQYSRFIALYILLLTNVMCMNY